MITVGAFEATTHLSRLLDRVAEGEEVLITKRGKPVARLVSVARADPDRVNDAFEKLKLLRKRTTLAAASLGRRSAMRGAGERSRPAIRRARAGGLTTYDAAYLELAMRRGLPLLTKDEALIAAAERTGVAVSA